MTQETFPKATNSLLSQEEKLFLDDMPDEVVRRIYVKPDASGISLTYIPKDASGVTQFTFEGERATAVRDYLEMLFAHGIRKDVRNG